MDKETIIAGKNALLVGLLLFLGAWIGWNFFAFYFIFSKMYKVFWWILMPTSIFGLILILIGVNWIIKGLIENRGEENAEKEES